MAELTPQKGQEPGWLALVCQMFTGPRAWMGWMMLIMGLVIFAFLVYTALEFMAAETVLASIHWGVWFLFVSMMMVTLKILSWMLILHKDIARRIDEKEGEGSHV